ncbi:MAG TPA: type II toxin-antitoxin system VapC family toxin [Thermoanaerobaculia bacterium]|jgi:predicted nucleic acid-binding protein
MFVIDSSAIVDFLIETAGIPRLDDVIRTGGLHAVSFVDLEVMQALRRSVIGRRLSEEGAVDALAVFGAIRITRHPHADLLHRIWQLRHNVTAYDAAYIALAEKLNLPLVTRDARLARSSGHAARIEHIA